MTNQEVQTLRIKNTIFLSRACPHCKTGKLYVDSDCFGGYISCANCGYTRDLEPATKQERKDWGVKRQSKVGAGK